ncbi:MAG TPA: prohead protease/major capsid protein fusion protein [Steroidobacteraceae bacterium]
MKNTNTPPQDHRERTARIEFERRVANDSRFPVTISTDAPVSRRDYDGEFEEVLSHDKDAVDLSRSPLPLIESHDRSRVNIGVVENLRIERDGGRKKLRGEVVLGQQARAQELAADIAAGIVSNISVGYSIEEIEAVEAKGSKRRIVATRWTPFEVSIVSVPADTNAGINRFIRGQLMSTMTKSKNRTRAATRAATVDAADQSGAEREIDNENDELESVHDGRNQPLLATRESRAAVRAERTRASTILNLVRQANLSDSFSEELIRSGISLREAREVIVDTMAADQARTQPNTRSQHGFEFGGFRVSGGEDFSSPEFRARAMGEAIFSRINGQHRPSEPAQQYVGRSLVELARESLHAANISTRMMGASRIIERALHGTSDFPIALGDAVGRELLRAFEAAEPGVLRAGRKVTAPDFKTRHRVKIGEAPRLERVNEHGEFKRGTIAEAQETYRLETFGKVFGITRQALVNDDLGAFDDLPRRMGIEARELESQTVVDLLVSNSGAGPTMSDGVALFHATHGNLAVSGGAIAVATIGAARAAMRLQKGLSGRVVNFVPRYLLVPAALETVGEQLLTSIEATKSSDTNPFAGKLELIVDPRLDAASATRWFLIADSDRYDGLEFAHLDSDNGPVTDTRIGFDVDGVEVKVRLDFGAGFVEHRSWYANAGG